MDASLCVSCCSNKGLSVSANSFTSSISSLYKVLGSCKKKKHATNVKTCRHMPTKQGRKYGNVESSGKVLAREGICFSGLESTPPSAGAMVAPTPLQTINGLKKLGMHKPCYWQQRKPSSSIGVVRDHREQGFLYSHVSYPILRWPKMERTGAASNQQGKEEKRKLGERLQGGHSQVRRQHSE